MPFERPSLPELRERIRADIRARLPEARPELRRSLLGVLADIESGGVHGLYGYLGWLAEQIMPDTAEAAHLERWADIWGVSRESGAHATGEITVTGSDGEILPQNTTLQTDDGTEYTTDDSAEIVDGEATVTVTAVDAGEDGNQDADVKLSLVSPVSGIDSTATVGANGLTGGADSESDSRLRERLLDRIRRPPHGGAKNDYVAWALAAHPDVTRAWVFPHELGLGTVTVRLVCDGLEDPIPTQAVLDTVEEYIAERRPVTADVSVAAPVAVPLDFTISIDPDTEEVRSRIEAAVRDHLDRRAEPGGTLYISQLNGEIYVAAGESLHGLQQPDEDQTYDAGEMAVMGDITWS
ncbi:MAG: baseplate J/gp47 family protein [Aquisalimonadaceae bacterium]